MIAEYYWFPINLKLSIGIYVLEMGMQATGNGVAIAKNQLLLSTKGMEGNWLKNSATRITVDLMIMVQMGVMCCAIFLASKQQT